LQLNEIVPLFGLVPSNRTQYSARCPAHDDKHESLSVSVGKDGQVLLNCHAGCKPEDIVQKIGITMKDLFPEKAAPRKIEATYDYLDADGKLIAQKIRYEGKTFAWRRPNGPKGWIYNRQGVTMVPYKLQKVVKVDEVFIVEGEKDVHTMESLGYVATCGPDGGGPGAKKWPDHFNEWFKSKTVRIIPDNDGPGQEYAELVAKGVKPFAKSCKVLNLVDEVPDLKEHGDISDVRGMFCGDEVIAILDKLADGATEWEQGCQKENPFFACFRPLDEFPEEEATWIIPKWIPENQITVLAADGGVGKTTLWCNIITALSNGTTCLLDPKDHTRAPMKVVFMTTEDSVRKKLKKKLRIAGANEKNIITPDFLADKEGKLRKIKFGTTKMEQVIKHFLPGFCVFDPVQGFISPELNMGSRNAMRDCMAPLVALGEEYLGVWGTMQQVGTRYKFKPGEPARLNFSFEPLAILGTVFACYDSAGNLKWERDISGNPEELHTQNTFKLEGGNVRGAPVKVCAGRVPHD